MRGTQFADQLGADVRLAIRQARPVKVNTIAATSSLFDTLGVQPLLGRTFTSDEEQFQGPHAVLLSERYWRDQFAGDPNILTRAFQLDGELYQVAGVMPQSFAFPNDVTEMWCRSHSNRAN
jgi:hypothetical protein